MHASFIPLHYKFIANKKKFNTTQLYKMAQVDELVTLLNNSSSESETTQSSTKSISTKKRGHNKHYSIIGTFDSKELIENEIQENQKDHTLLSKKKTREGVKHFYRCKRPLYKGPQCDTGLYYIMPSENLKFELYKTNCKFYISNKSIT